MHALRSKGNLGSATQSSLPGWIILCEKQNCQCVHHACVSIEYVLCCLFGTRRYPPTHTTGDNACAIINSSSTASLRWICTQVPIFAFVGVFYLSKCSFSMDNHSSRLHILSVNSIWTACEFNNHMEISQNAETFNHLALLTMLSALKHGWGLLAQLCGNS